MVMLIIGFPCPLAYVADKVRQFCYKVRLNKVYPFAGQRRYLDSPVILTP